MTRASEEWRPTLLMLVILPFWTSFLIRVYAWIGILGQEGFLNQTLMFLGLTWTPDHSEHAHRRLYRDRLYLSAVYDFTDLFALEKLDDSLLEAAEDLGCSRIKAFWLVTFPLSRGGIYRGLFPCLYSNLGRICDPIPIGRIKHIDDW